MTEAYNPAQIEFLQQLFDRYSEGGGIIDLADDHPAFMKIVMRNVPHLAQAALRAQEGGDV